MILTDNRTTVKRERKVLLKCSAEERDQIIEVAADRRMEFVEPSFLEILNHAINEVLPGKRKVGIAKLSRVPEDIFRAIETRYHEKVTSPLQIVEVDRPVTQSFDLQDFSLKELKEEVLRRELMVFEELEALRHRVSELGQSQVNVIVNNGPQKPVMIMPPITPVKHWKIGLVGFSGGQIDALRRKTVNHTNKTFDIRELGKRKNHLFSGSVDVVLSWRTRIDQGHVDRLLGKLEGVVPIGWVSNLDDAVRKVTNVCIGRHIDHQG